MVQSWQTDSNQPISANNEDYKLSISYKWWEWKNCSVHSVQFWSVLFSTMKIKISGKEQKHVYFGWGKWKLVQRMCNYLNYISSKIWFLQGCLHWYGVTNQPIWLSITALLPRLVGVSLWLGLYNILWYIAFQTCIIGALTLWLCLVGCCLTLHPWLLHTMSYKDLHHAWSPWLMYI